MHANIPTKADTRYQVQQLLSKATTRIHLSMCGLYNILLNLPSLLAYTPWKFESRNSRYILSDKSRLMLWLSWFWEGMPSSVLVHYRMTLLCRGTDTVMKSSQFFFGWTLLFIIWIMVISVGRISARYHMVEHCHIQLAHVMIKMNDITKL